MKAASPADVRAALTAMGFAPPAADRIMRAVAHHPLRRALVRQRAEKTTCPPLVRTKKAPIMPRSTSWHAAPVHVELPIPPFRWTPGRKALVVAAVRNGQIAFGAACLRFEISAAEMLDWMDRATLGERALRITKRPGDRT